MSQSETPPPYSAVPVTPGIREIRSDSESECFDLIGIANDQNFFLKKPNNVVMNGRVEIDTSPPFGSVKEAVTHFGGSGSWIPLHRLREAYNGVDDNDIKKVEEQAAELEKDLIVKELETLDVLEELANTKRIVEELKRKLQTKAVKCLKNTSNPHSDELMSTTIKEMNKENGCNHFNYNDHLMENSVPCPISSPDLILMELKETKLNLGKTITDIGVIQTSVESLNRRMKKEKYFLEKTRKRLASNFAAVSSLEEIKEIGGNPPLNIAREVPPLIPETGNLRRKAETANVEVARARQGIEETHASLKTAEMRLDAAKKMEEAARATEALALAEIKALSGTETSSEFVRPEHNEKTQFSIENSSPTPKSQKSKVLNPKKVIYTMVPIGEANISKLAVFKKLEEATAEIRYCKRALEEALSRIDIANRKQFEAEEAFRRWTPEHDQDETGMYSTRLKMCHLAGHFCDTPHDSDLANDDVKPVLKSTTSMRDVLSKKQVQPNQFTVRNQTGHPERQKVALSQMLQEFRDDLALPIKPSKAENHPKQFLAQRKKFGFIHISLPLTKQSKKKAEALNMI